MPLVRVFPSNEAIHNVLNRIHRLSMPADHHTGGFSSHLEHDIVVWGRTNFHIDRSL